MQKYLIIALSLAVLLVIFALQNTESVILSLWFWEIQLSMAMLVLLTFGVGALTGVLFSTPTIIRSKRKAHQLKKEVDEAEKHSKKEVSQEEAAS